MEGEPLPPPEMPSAMTYRRDMSKFLDSDQERVAGLRDHMKEFNTMVEDSDNQQIMEQSSQLASSLAREDYLSPPMLTNHRSQIFAGLHEALPGNVHLERTLGEDMLEKIKEFAPRKNANYAYRFDNLTESNVTNLLNTLEDIPQKKFKKRGEYKNIYFELRKKDLMRQFFDEDEGMRYLINSGDIDGAKDYFKGKTTKALLKVPRRKIHKDNRGNINQILDEYEFRGDTEWLPSLDDLKEPALKVLENALAGPDIGKMRMPYIETEAGPRMLDFEKFKKTTHNAGVSEQFNALRGLEPLQSGFTYSGRPVVRERIMPDPLPPPDARPRPRQDLPPIAELIPNPDVRERTRPIPPPAVVPPALIPPADLRRRTRPVPPPPDVRERTRPPERFPRVKPEDRPRIVSEDSSTVAGSFTKSLAEDIDITNSVLRSGDEYEWRSAAERLRFEIDNALTTPEWQKISREFRRERKAPFHELIEPRKSMYNKLIKKYSTLDDPQLKYKVARLPKKITVPTSVPFDNILDFKPISKTKLPKTPEEMDAALKRSMDDDDEGIGSGKRNYNLILEEQYKGSIVRLSDALKKEEDDKLRNRLGSDLANNINRMADTDLLSYHEKILTYPDPKDKTLLIDNFVNKQRILKNLPDYKRKYETIDYDGPVDNIAVGPETTMEELYDIAKTARFRQFINSKKGKDFLGVLGGSAAAPKFQFTGADEDMDFTVPLEATPRPLPVAERHVKRSRI